MDTLENIDPDDIEFLLKDVEKSFGFRFDQTSLKNVSTFGELCDVITGKLEGRDTNDCTTQQAFYKLRSALCEELLIDSNSIIPGTELLKLFPAPGRRQKIRAFHDRLGFNVIILGVRPWLRWSLFLGIILSLAALFFYWPLALCGLL